MGWLHFDGFHLVWYAKPYPDTSRISYQTRAQSGQNILEPGPLGVGHTVRHRPFSDARLKESGPIPPGLYDVLINDAGTPTLLPGYDQRRDVDGVVYAVYRHLKPAFGMQRIPDDIAYGLDNPRTPDRDESFTQAEVWGRYRARIVPRPRTNTYGRAGFYLHSSNKERGTLGCIETRGDEYIFLRLMSVRETEGVRKIPLVVHAAADWLWEDDIREITAETPYD